MFYEKSKDNVTIDKLIEGNKEMYLIFNSHEQYLECSDVWNNLGIINPSFVFISPRGVFDLLI